MARAKAKAKKLRKTSATPAWTEPPRFFLDPDDDGHWYLVPEAQREAWDAFQAAGYPEGSWPPGVRRLNGPMNELTFVSPGAHVGGLLIDPR